MFFLIGRLLFWQNLVAFFFGLLEQLVMLSLFFLFQVRIEVFASNKSVRLVGRVSLDVLSMETPASDIHFLDNTSDLLFWVVERLLRVPFPDFNLQLGVFAIDEHAVAENVEVNFALLVALFLVRNDVEVLMRDHNSEVLLVFVE